MPELDQIKKDMAQIAIELSAARQNFLHALSLPPNTKVSVERHPTGRRLVIELPSA